MTGIKIAGVLSALVIFASALAGCTTSSSLVDQTVQAAEFGPPITGTMGVDAGTAMTAGPVRSLPVAKSAGCGMPVPGTQLLASYSQYSASVTGATLDPAVSVGPYARTYFVWLPKDYDSSKPYRVTFLFMGCGNRTAANTATYKLMSKDPESIYVAIDMPPAGLPPAGKDCYDNTVGKSSVEWEAMGVIASTVQNQFCIDENRVFVSGYSSGAWVSNMFGCYFAGKDPNRQFGKEISVRGQASVTGGPVLPDVPCGGKVAALWIHDTDDPENIIGGNLTTSLPRVLAVNGCTDGAKGKTAPWGTSVPTLMDVCKEYTDCPPAYPVIFCTTSGFGHASQDPTAVPAFIEFQNLMDPK